MIWFLLGCLFIGVQLLVHEKVTNMGEARFWPDGIMVLLANLSIIFGVAWAYESIIEYEIQAAVMGIVSFGGVGVIFAVIAYRLINKDKQKTVKDN